MSTVQDSSTRLFWLIILSVFLSPLAVAIEFGAFTWLTLANLILAILLPFGGFIHAVYYLTKARYAKDSHEGYERLEDDAADCEQCRTQQPAPRATSPEIQQTTIDTRIDPPPYAENGSNPTLDNKIQRNA